MLNLIVISLPPQNLLKEFQALASELSDLTGAREAQKYPPHVTLRTGFLLPETEEAMSHWKDSFSQHLEQVDPVLLSLDGLVMNSYQDKESGSERYFCGFGVKRSPELMGFHRGLLDYSPYKKREQTSYHPHLSLAYKDLSLEGFAKIQDWLQQNPTVMQEKRNWRVDRISVYRQEGVTWVPLEEFAINATSLHST